MTRSKQRIADAKITGLVEGHRVNDVAYREIVSALETMEAIYGEDFDYGQMHAEVTFALLVMRRFEEVFQRYYDAAMDNYKSDYPESLEDLREALARDLAQKKHPSVWDSGEEY